MTIAREDDTGVEVRSLSAPWVAVGHESQLLIRSDHPVTIQIDGSDWKFSGRAITTLNVRDPRFPIQMTMDDLEMRLGPLRAVFYDEDHVRQTTTERWDDREAVDDASPRVAITKIFAAIADGNVAPLVQAVVGSEFWKQNEDELVTLWTEELKRPLPDRLLELSPEDQAFEVWVAIYPRLLSVYWIDFTPVEDFFKVGIHFGDDVWFVDFVHRGGSLRFE